MNLVPDLIGMTLTVHTGKGIHDVLVFERVHVDSVKVKDGCLTWEEDGPRMRIWTIHLSRVLYWETE